MGPPIYIGGNTPSPVGGTIGGVLLQWGHRFTSVETFNNRIIHSPFNSASMGPPIYIGGNVSVDIGIEVPPCASMGPPIYIGGNQLFS